MKTYFTSHCDLSGDAICQGTMIYLHWYDKTQITNDGMHVLAEFIWSTMICGERHACWTIFVDTQTMVVFQFLILQIWFGKEGFSCTTTHYRDYGLLLINQEIL